MANACRGFIMPTAISGSVGDIQSLRTEMKEDITRVQTQLTEIFNSAMEQMQAEADRRTAVALERLVQQVQDASKQANNDGTTARTAHAVLSEKTQRSLRDEIKEDIAGVQVQLTEVLNAATEKMQRESDRKAEVMLERLEQKLHEASEQLKKKAASTAVTHTIPGSGINQELHSQPTQESQRTWANVTRAGTQTAAEWTTISNRKEKPKK
jgi:cation transport regulator ChaB